MDRLPRPPDPTGRVLHGFEHNEDAVILRSPPPGMALVQTVDVLAPIGNNPRRFGQTAAANALSDVYAVGDAIEITDFVTGNKGYVIVGGTVDHFGWAEFFGTESGTGSLTGLDYADTYLVIDGVRQPSYELSEELVEKLNNDPSYELESVNRPWFQAALDQLEMDY